MKNSDKVTSVIDLMAYLVKKNVVDRQKDEKNPVQELKINSPILNTSKIKNKVKRVEENLEAT